MWGGKTYGRNRLEGIYQQVSFVHINFEIQVEISNWKSKEKSKLR